jgi:hypothetical protein
MTSPVPIFAGPQAAAYSAPAVFPPVTPSGFKDVGIAYILLIFFGGLGVHKFYLGSVGMGILYIFTAGLFGIGTLVDIFTLNSQVRRANAGISGRGY